MLRQVKIKVNNAILTFDAGEIYHSDILSEKLLNHLFVQNDAIEIKKPLKKIAQEKKEPLKKQLKKKKKPLKKIAQEKKEYK